MRAVGAIVGCIVLLAPVTLAAPATFWVSPSGDDANAGTEAAPFRTLEHATEVVNATGSGPVTVNIADGTYRLAHPLAFGPNTPPATFQAVPGAHPVISGAVQITGWKLVDKARNIYSASAGSNVSRQLYVDGRRAIRARTEVPGGNNPAGFLPVAAGIQFIPTSLNPAGWRDPEKWHNQRDIEAVVLTQWKMMSVPLASVTASTSGKPGLITMRQPGWKNATLFQGTLPGTCTPDTKQLGIWGFWQVTRFENAYEFLDQPGEWYLDRPNRTIYYIPRHGEDLARADVELPMLETLVQGIGTADKPLANLRFTGLTFVYATWMEPGGDQGYVADQSGFRVTGSKNPPNVIGHVKDVVRTPGNLRFEYAQSIVFDRNTFSHLGAVALDFGTGSQNDSITSNTFSDISSAAIQLGGVSEIDARPAVPSQATTHNTISNNLIFQTGREYVDSAAIFAGFTSWTDISHNTISDVPWSGIAIGWGWGLLDNGMYLGVPCATTAMWGSFSTNTINSHNAISFNRISRFIENRWDGGAIYSTGQQGQSMDDPLVIEGNVAYDKRTRGGGNTFYTDGGSRYVLVKANASFDDPIGYIDLGPLPQANDPLPYPPLALANVLAYGSDSGGCRTYGDIHYENNYWMEGAIPYEELFIGTLATLVSRILHITPSLDPYSPQGFYDVCPYTDPAGVSHPANMTYASNHNILGEWEIPREILANAGLRASRPQ